MNTCIKSAHATQYPYTLIVRSVCFSAALIILYISIKNTNTKPAEPTNPHSSPTVQNMKSVLCSGTILNLVWVPWRSPLPLSPPEPIAILDWWTLYPAPFRSSVIPHRFSILSLWWALSTLSNMSCTEKINNTEHIRLNTKNFNLMGLFDRLFLHSETATTGIINNTL